MEGRRHDWIWRRRCGSDLEEDEGREDHEETFSEGSCDFAVVELTDRGIVFFGEVDTDFFPSLTHGLNKLC